MNAESVLAWTAAIFSALLAFSGVVRKRRSVASWFYFSGMIGLAAESILAVHPAVAPQSAVLAIRALLPTVWLCFSLTYSRGEHRDFFRKWLPAIFIVLLFPVALLVLFQMGLLQRYSQATKEWEWQSLGAVKALNGYLLLVAVLILMNLERTFRSAVGTMLWRIKFFLLGIGVIFGARIYTQSQVLIFSANTLALSSIETVALLIGSTLMTIGYFRSGFKEIDVYPSRAVLQTSLTVLLVGGYLFVVGVLAQVVARSGGAERFRLQAFLVLLGIVVLAVLLMSDRFRQSIQQLISRHFKRPRYDFRVIWTRFTQSTSAALDGPSLCAAAAELISQTFNVLSVTFWLFDEEKERLTFGASTAESVPAGNSTAANFMAGDSGLLAHRGPFDLERVKGDWAETLRTLSASQFRRGGNRICVPLQAGERWLGAAILADRVSGLPYTIEEFDLLKCIGDQVAGSLLNLSLTAKVMLGKELGAFQTISTFFVHDLKNAASTLSLMLENLPIHFDDPAFRADALRGIRDTADRIKQMIGRLSAVRRKLELRLIDVDVNALIDETLQHVPCKAGIEWVRELQPMPNLRADREQLGSVLTNLLLNACDAIGDCGRITLETEQRGKWAAVSVSDNGCGMAQAFMRDSLFRPFQTTKKKGLGIGMFQSKLIVDAHGGNIRVRSEPGKGTTFHVLLPLEH
ncbi:MAG: PEP-CTERM system histidine kinase PrsK [Chthoniobacterales bacterium]|nr:PEP-CTERM system histidine kinase PrsK [Chthoniobacterales bacterium]